MAKAGELKFTLVEDTPPTLEQCVDALEKGRLLPANEVHLPAGSIFTVVFDGRFYQYLADQSGQFSCTAYAAKTSP
jgi:hypothetical protein